MSAEPLAPVERIGARVGGKTLPVAVIDGGEERTPLVATLGIVARIDDFELARYRYLAAMQRRRIVVVDTPGWLLGSPRSGTVRTDLRQGSFRGVASHMLEALHGTVPELLNDPVCMVGYSMGCSSAAALARQLVEAGVALPHLTLVEPVAIKKLNMVRLGVRNQREALTRWHASDNRAIGWAPKQSPRPPMPAVAPGALSTLGHFAWALSRGQLAEDLTMLIKVSPSAFSIINGADSRLAPTPATKAFAALLRSAGARVEHHTVPRGRHGLWNSIPVVEQVSAWIG